MKCVVMVESDAVMERVDPFTFFRGSRRRKKVSTDLCYERCFVRLLENFYSVVRSLVLGGHRRVVSILFYV